MISTERVAQGFLHRQRVGLDDFPTVHFCEVATPQPWPCAGWDLFPHLLIWDLAMGLALANDILVNGMHIEA